tara:strand:- start:762 stop:1076 length:315 start_codon:yes stop_codon:yes gene_type:complete
MATRFAGDVIRQGRQNQRAANETPTSFATDAGASDVDPTNDLARNPNRRAPQTGIRAQELMENPKAAAIEEGWTNAFKQSNQGVAFYKGKMNQDREINGFPPIT